MATENTDPAIIAASNKDPENIKEMAMLAAEGLSSIGVKIANISEKAVNASKEKNLKETSKNVEPAKNIADNELEAVTAKTSPDFRAGVSANPSSVDNGNQAAEIDIRASANFNLNQEANQLNFQETGVETTEILSISSGTKIVPSFSPTVNTNNLNFNTAGGGEGTGFASNVNVNYQKTNQYIADDELTKTIRVGYGAGLNYYPENKTYNTNFTAGYSLNKTNNDLGTTTNITTANLNVSQTSGYIRNDGSDLNVNSTNVNLELRQQILGDVELKNPFNPEKQPLVQNANVQLVLGSNNSFGDAANGISGWQGETRIGTKFEGDITFGEKDRNTNLPFGAELSEEAVSVVTANLEIGLAGNGVDKNFSAAPYIEVGANINLNGSIKR